MSAVLGAFVHYILQMFFFIIVAGAGIFCGKKMHDKKKLESEN